jgi:hypothetical protein
MLEFPFLDIVKNVSLEGELEGKRGRFVLIFIVLDLLGHKC